MKEQTIKKLAPVVALVAALLYTVLPRTWFGNRATQWNPLRRYILPALDNLKRDHTSGYAMYALEKGEYVGTTDATVREVGQLLDAEDYTRMPLSALKKNHTGEVIESASWSYRDSLFARRQTHVMLFDLGNGKTAVYAHDEYNAYSPWVAYKHYRGIGQTYATGVTKINKLLLDSELTFFEERD